MVKLPTVVIAGRTNVGKSTLFNRLSDSVKSITLDQPGVTRDLLRDTVHWNNAVFELIDTGGIDLRDARAPIVDEIVARAFAAIDDAAVIILVVDGTTGVLSEDREIAEILRKHEKKVILAVNKLDVKKTADNLGEFYELYHTELLTISAEHGLGMPDLFDAIIKMIPKLKRSEKIEKPAYRVVMLGKPNVGKSSLMNILLEQERTMVSDVPGTTREAISESISFYKEQLQITDTPGIRRRRAIKGDLEPLMVKSAFKALKNSDIVLLMIDASEARLVDQELKLAFYAFEDLYKSLILLINKSDLFDEFTEQQLESSFDEYQNLLKKIVTLKISCKTGKNIGKILPLIKSVWQRYNFKISDEELSMLLVGESQKRPIFYQKRQLEVYSVRQLAVAPPTILLLVNDPKMFGPSQLRFFENVLRKKYDFRGVPIKIITGKK